MNAERLFRRSAPFDVCQLFSDGLEVFERPVLACASREGMDRDEIAWAATEMYLATGDPHIHEMLVKEFNPADP